MEMTEKEKYKYRKENHLCTMCGKPVNKNSRICKKCKEKVSERNKFQYKFCVDNGICPQCKKRKADIGTVLCEECKKKRKEEWFRHSDIRNAKKAKREKYKRQKLIKNGLCPKCGKPVTTGKKCCEECLKYMRDQSAIYRIRHNTKHVGIPKSEWSQYGWCNICGIAFNGGGKICPSCKEKNVAQASKMRARLAEKKKIWEEQGLCTRCGKNPHAEGIKICEKCRGSLKKARKKVMPDGSK